MPYRRYRITILLLLAVAQGAEPVDRAADDYTMAAWLFATKRYDMAVEDLRAFIKNYPDNAKRESARLLLGRAYRQLKRYDDAVRTFEALRKEKPGFSNMPELLYELARAHADHGKHREAETVFARLLAAHGNHYLIDWARSRRASTLLAMKRFAEAEATLTKLIAAYLTGPDAEKRRNAKRKDRAAPPPGVRHHSRTGLAQPRTGAERGRQVRCRSQDL